MTDYARTVEPYAVALFLIREAIGDLFGPMADLCSEEATLTLYGPEPIHDAEAIIAALHNIRNAIDGRQTKETA